MYKIIGVDQKQYGPVSADEMRQWIAEGRVNAQTLLQAEGQTDWRPLSSFPEFATVAQSLPSGAPQMVGPSADARSLVSGPAIGLLVVGIICALGALWGVLSHVLGLGMGAFAPGGPGAGNMPPQVTQWMALMAGGVGLVLNIVGLGLSALFIFASQKMRKIESYGLVMTSTIISMVPCLSPCCCIGLPIGIWVLVVLCKPEVKASFR